MSNGTIINLTQHLATPAQVAGGVFDLCGSEGKAIQKLLIFTEIPLGPEVRDRAHSLAILAASITPDVTGALIGGPHFLTGPLHIELTALGIQPMYAFPAGGFVTLHFPKE